MSSENGVPLTITLLLLMLTCFTWLSCFLLFGKWHAKGDGELTHLALIYPRVAITVCLVCIQAPIVHQYVHLRFQPFGSQCDLTSDVSVATGQHGSCYGRSLAPNIMDLVDFSFVSYLISCLD